MERERLFDLCGVFYASNRVPMGIFAEDGKCVFTRPESMGDYPFTGVLSELMASTELVAYTSDKNGLFFSLIREKESGFAVLLGPASATPLDEDALRNVMRDHFISGKQFEDLKTLFHYIPLYSYYRFLSLAALLLYMLTGVLVRPQTIPGNENSSYSLEEVQQKIADTAYGVTQEQNNNLWISYQSEQAFLALVDSGDVEESLRFASKPDNFVTGIVAGDTLRQHKNIAIIIVSLLARHAIRAGVGVQKAYQMSDTYLQEIERTGQVSHVFLILQDATAHYVQRIREEKVPEGLSRMIYQCVQFVGRCVNEPITVEDVADYVEKSASYVSACFKKEMGTSLGNYIVQIKIEEAQRMLRFTDKSLFEISDYLCFSSQSYFQSVFKRLTGTTPQKYRNASKSR